MCTKCNSMHKCSLRMHWMFVCVYYVLFTVTMSVTAAEDKFFSTKMAFKMKINDLILMSKPMLLYKRVMHLSLCAALNISLKLRPNQSSRTHMHARTHT